MTLLGWLMRLTVWYFWHCCRLPFLGSVMMKDWVHGVGHSSVCQILLQIVMRSVITSSPPTWTSSAEMLSTLADFPFFNDCTAASTSLWRMGWSSSVSVWGQSSTDGSPLALQLYSSVQHSVRAVGRFFEPVREGISCSCPARVSQLWVKQLVSTWHYWVDIFIVQRKVPDGQKGSTMNSTATCSTWRGMGFFRLYFANDSSSSSSIP